MDVSEGPVTVLQGSCVKSWGAEARCTDFLALGDPRVWSKDREDLGCIHGIVRFWVDYYLYEAAVSMFDVG